MTSAEAKAAYKEIQDWVHEKYGFHVTNLNIVQAKKKHDILNEITETRIYCGFRENMNQESTKPYRRSRFKMAWLIDSWMFYPRIYIFHGLY